MALPEAGPPETAGVLLEHLFRHQAGRMVAHFTRLLGPANLELAEEAVQEAMLRALESWPYSGVPANPPAWLFRVAHNAAIDAVRRAQKALPLDADESETLLNELSGSPPPPDNADLEEQLRDDELRMIVMCCHPEIPAEAAVALSLKTVGGFSVREIACAFLAEETAIAQRVVRAKRQIREQGLTLDVPRGAELELRLDSVMEVIYCMFNEGYTAHEGENLVRKNLCEEGLRLGRLVASSSISAPRVHALVALMAFQAARLPARTDEAGDLILLDSQDRRLWDRDLIALGFHHFELSMSGDTVSPYHAEAAIAATHARATGPADTDWHMILQLYDQLLTINPSPVVALNRAVAISKVHGPAVALRAVEPLVGNRKLRDYHLLLAVRGHLLLELGSPREAAACFREAISRRCSAPERRFLTRKLAECEFTISPGTETPVQ
jgi:RNA polymerase sigma-70 factor, ECF subfamily